MTGTVLQVEVAIDSVGRLVLPKALRDRLGFTPGTVVDITHDGDGLHVAVGGRTARLERRDGVLVATSHTPIDDSDVFSLLETIRR